MTIKILLVALVVLGLLLDQAQAFSIVSGRPKKKVASTTASSLFSTVPLDEDFLAVLNRATECSTSETCSTEEAEMFVKQLQGIDQQQLEDDIPGKVISDLLTKIERTKDVRNQVPPSVVASASCVAFAMILTMIATSNFGGEEREALTLQEWWWAIRGNYFPTILIHFIRHGGL